MSNKTKQNTVLIVDDVPLYQDFLKAIVEKSGYQTHACEDGPQAISYLRDNQDSVRLILLDIHMPQLDGISVLGHFRSQYPNLPVVVISGSTDPNEEKISIELGAFCYIPKETNQPQIEAKIQALLKDN